MNDEEYFRRADELMQTRSRSKALNALGEDPDKAAQAVQLQKTTGQDSQMIYGDNERFMGDYTARLTERMLDRNPGLAEYIEAHPMAAIVSKDDWDKMADFYDRLDQYKYNIVPGSKALTGAVHGFMTHFWEAMTSAPIGQWAEKQAQEQPGTKAWMEAHPRLTMAAKIYGAPLELAFRALGASVAGVEGAGYGAGIASGQSETSARMLGRSLAAGAEWFTSDMAHVGVHVQGRPIELNRMAMELQKVMDVEFPEAMKVAKKIEPHLRANELPPLGIHPAIDAAIGEHTKQTMSIYDALEDSAKAAETGKRSPDMLQLAAEIKTKQPLFLHWDKVRKIYGDKIPEPGDGLLGDIPGFAEQYQNAIDTRTDIQVKIPEWLAKVPDEVRKEFHDDLRLRPDEPTLNQLKEAAVPTLEQGVKALEQPTPPEPSAITPPVEEPLSRLTRLRGEYATRLTTHGAIEGKEAPQGNLLQSLRAVTGKEFDPGDVSTAMKWGYFNERPDIVARALELAELSDPQLHAKLEMQIGLIEKNKAAMDAIRRETASRHLMPPDEFQTLNQLLATGEWEQIGTITVIRPTGKVSVAEQAVITKVEQLFEQMGGPEAGALLRAAREIRIGTDTPTPVRGAHMTPIPGDLYKNPTIAFLIGSTNPAKTMSHEILHHFYRYGFLRENEWSQLMQTSLERGWREKHKIDEKYFDAPEELKKEEAVVAEFEEWFEKRTARDETGGIFQKIADFFANIKSWLKEKFGFDPTTEEIFEAIYRGKVGQRKPYRDPLYGGIPLEAAARLERPDIEVPKIEGEEGPSFLKGLLPKKTIEQYLRVINRDNAADVKELFNEAWKEEKKRQEPEWRARFAQQYEESLGDLKNRPDYKIAAFFRNGVFGPGKMDSLPKIDPDFLTPEQRKALPKNWQSKTIGWNPDDLAPSFGLKTGREMIDSVIAFEQKRGRQKSEAFVERQAWHEAERRMEQQYGKLDENIMEDAREHAIGKTKFDLMYQEGIALGTLLGQELPMTKEKYQAQAQLKFNSGLSSQVSIMNYTKQLGQINKATEQAWLKGDTATAFQLRQESLQVMALAQLAGKFEKEQKRPLERLLKLHSPMEVKGLPPEWNNWIHQIMFRIDRAPKRTPQGLRENIELYPDKTLGEFVAKRELEGLPEREILEEYGVEVDSSLPVADFLMEMNERGEYVWNKALDETTVGEYTKVHDSLKALRRLGRNVEKIRIHDREVDYKEHLGKMIDQAGYMGEAWIPRSGEKTSLEKTRLWLQNQRANLLQMEFVWDRLDKGNRRGIFSKTFTDTFSTAGNEYRVLIGEFSLMMRDLKRYKVDLKEQLPHNIFYDPLYGIPKEGRPPEVNARLLDGGRLSRGTLRGIMLNVGNASNLDKMARAYGTTPEAIMNWVNTHAKQEDWLFVQGVGKIFEELQNRSDARTFNLTGVKMERLPLEDIQTNFGTMEGFYYPMMWDRFRDGGHRGKELFPNPPPLIRRNTVHGWEIKRTGYAGPIDFSLEQLPTQLTNRIRDIAFREVLITNGKFFRDQRFRDMMTTRMGRSYTDMLDPYIQDIAGTRAAPAYAIAELDKAMSFIQQAAVHVFIGYKLSTTAKHNITAFIQSFGDVKAGSMLKSVIDLYRTNSEVMKTNNKWVMEQSAMLKGRERHYTQSFGVPMDEVTGHMALGEKSAYWAAYPVAKIDMLASKMLWLAKYRDVMDELKPTAMEELAGFNHDRAHREAVMQADMAVRRTHGETAITSRPQFMRTPALRNLAALYGFWNHIFNRLYRMTWQGSQLAKDVRAGTATMADVRQVTSAFFFNIVVPGYVGAWVTSQFGAKESKEEHSLLYNIIHPLAIVPFESIPIVREVTMAIETGMDPAMGIGGGAMKMLTDSWKLKQKLEKKGEIGPEDWGDIIHKTNLLVGLASRLPFTDQLGKWEKFGINYMLGMDEPASRDEWIRAIMTGKSAPSRR